MERLTTLFLAFSLSFAFARDSFATTHYYELAIRDAELSYSISSGHLVTRSPGKMDRVVVEVDTEEGKIRYAAQLSGDASLICSAASCEPLSEEQLQNEVFGTTSIGGTLFDTRDRYIEGDIWPPLLDSLPAFADITSVDTDVYRNDAALVAFAESIGGPTFLPRKLSQLEFWQSQIPFDFSSLRSDPGQKFEGEFIDRSALFYGLGLETAGVQYFSSFTAETIAEIFSADFATDTGRIEYALNDSSLSFSSPGTPDDAVQDYQLQFDGRLAYVGTVVPAQAPELIGDCNANGVDDLDDVRIERLLPGSVFFPGDSFLGADFNSDGRLDVLNISESCLAGNCRQEKVLKVLLNAGDGSFSQVYSTAIPFDAEATPFAEPITDYPSIEIDSESEPAFVLRNDGSGRNFGRVADFARGVAIAEIGSAELPELDLDGDGRSETVSANIEGLLTIVLSDSLDRADYPLPPEIPRLTGGYFIRQAAAQDVDRDGNLDALIILRANDSNLDGEFAAFFPGDGDGTLGTGLFIGGEVGTSFFADLDNDGTMEFIVRDADQLSLAESGLSVFSLKGTGRALRDRNSNYLPDSCEGKFALWNSYLDMFNILELVNPQQEEATAEVRFFDIEGKLVYSRDITLPAGSQFDLILNNLFHFKRDSYGLVQVRGTMSGRLVFYKQAANSAAFLDKNEFAYSVELLERRAGSSFVGFNTFNPTTAAVDAAFPVWNWLSVVNLSAVRQEYSIERFAQDGSLIDTRQVFVNGFTRADINAGHDLVFERGRLVGLLKVTPRQSSAPYLALNTRYNFNNRLGSFEYAFSQTAAVPGSSSTRLSFHRTASSRSWIELLNASSEPLEYSATWYNADGSIAEMVSSADSPQFFPGIAPGAQVHVPADFFTPGKEPGHVQINSERDEALIARMLYYDYSNIPSAISAFAFPETPAADDSLTASYNTLLGMESLISVSNFSASEVSGSVTLKAGFDEFARAELSIPARGSRTLSVRSLVGEPLAGQGYGTVTFTPNATADVGMYVLRSHPAPDASGADFAFPAVGR